MRIKINATTEQFYYLARILWDKLSIDIEIVERRNGEYDLMINYANSQYYNDDNEKEEQ